MNDLNEKKYLYELFDLIGMLGIMSDEEMVKNYGITYLEYIHPTKETVEKVKSKVKVLNESIRFSM